MVTALLIIHGLAAVFLIGALTHQAASLIPFSKNPDSPGFVRRFAAVRPAGYAGAVIVLYLVTAVFGAIIYPDYTLGPRSEFRDTLPPAYGSFELKEHFGALGVGLLPIYWSLWRQHPPENEIWARRIFTGLLTFIAWLGYLVGHVLNNLGGV